MEKKRYEIQIADVDLAILSDEREDFVMSAVAQLDSRIRDLTVTNKRCSKMDAALLCALDYFSDKLKAEKRVRNLEAQISLYDANMRRMREDNIRLKAKLGISGGEEENASTAEADASKTASSETASSKTASSETASSKTASSEKIASEKISSEKAASENASPVKAASEENAPAKGNAPACESTPAGTVSEKNAAADEKTPAASSHGASETDKPAGGNKPNEKHEESRQLKLRQIEDLLRR